MSTIGTSRGHQEFSPFRVLCKAILLIKEPVIQKDGQLTFVRTFPEINVNTRPRKAIPQRTAFTRRGRISLLF